MAIGDITWRTKPNNQLVVRKEIKEFGLLLPDGSEVWEQDSDEYDYTELVVEGDYQNGSVFGRFYIQLRGDNSTVADVQACLDDQSFKAYVLTRTRFVYEYLTDAKVHFTTARGVVTYSLSDLNESEGKQELAYSGSIDGENDCLEDYR